MKYLDQENYNNLLKKKIGHRNLLCDWGNDCVYQIYRQIDNIGTVSLMLRCEKCLGAGNFIPLSEDFEKYPLFDEDLKKKHSEKRRFQLEIIERKLGIKFLKKTDL